MDKNCALHSTSCVRLCDLFIEVRQPGAEGNPLEVLNQA